MFKLLGIVLTSLFLVGCVTYSFPGPEALPSLDTYLFSVNYHSLSDIPSICNTPNAVGCFEPFTLPCEIHVVKGDWCSLIHEMQHCIHGFWHGDIPTGNGDCK